MSVPTSASDSHPPTGFRRHTSMATGTPRHWGRENFSELSHASLGLQAPNPSGGGPPARPGWPRRAQAQARADAAQAEEPEVLRAKAAPRSADVAGGIRPNGRFLGLGKPAPKRGRLVQMECDSEAALRKTLGKCGSSRAKHGTHFLQELHQISIWLP